MSSPFLGEVRMFGLTFSPRGWAYCNGQQLAINQNQALFSLLGTTFGGNGTTTFALPDLQGRTPVHVGSGPGLPSYAWGQKGGAETHTLTAAELPSHSHGATGTSSSPNVSSPSGATWATGVANAYGTSPNGSMSAASVGNAGGGQAHPNMPPYLVLNFVIALQGIFPSRN